MRAFTRAPPTSKRARAAGSRLRIPGPPAAEGDDDPVASEGEARETVLEPGLGVARLVDLAGGKDEERRAQPAPREAPREQAPIQTADRRIGDDGNLGRDPPRGEAARGEIPDEVL